MAQAEVSSEPRDLRSQADRKPALTAPSRTLQAIAIASCVDFPLLDEVEAICLNSMRIVVNATCQLYLTTCYGCIVGTINHYAQMVVSGA